MFELWIPTRYRLQYCERMLGSLSKSDMPAETPIRFMVDYGECHERDTLLKLGDDLRLNVAVIDHRHKSSLVKLWNQSIIESEADWTFITGDDSIFLRGWYAKCVEYMSNDNLDLVYMAHYAGFAINKRLIPACGWFDERFLGGGYEDVDYQIRLSEAGVLNRVGGLNDPRLISHSRHTMDTHDQGHWRGYGNETWWMKKWSKAHCEDFKSANIRTEDEVDWYPLHTEEYAARFGVTSQLDMINKLPRVHIPIV